MSGAGWRRIAVVVVVGSLVAACGGGSSKSNNAKSTSSTSSASDKTDRSDVSDVSDFSDNNPVVGKKTKFGPTDDDKILKASVKDIEDFWTEQFPKTYGTDYVRVAHGLHPYGPAPSDPPPSCPASNQPAKYDDNPMNAFYCIRGDFVAWDTDNLTNDLLNQFGPFTLAIVAAHELGHGVSARAGVYDANPPTFLTEQQADCFAGAYTQWVAEGRSGLFELKLSDLDSALGGFLQIRDPVGFDSVNDPQGHGSAFQRINAFEDGLKGGADTCKDYANGTFTVVPDTFVDETDYENQGNLAASEVEPAVTANLDAFWTAAIADINKTWTPLKVNAYDPDSGSVKCGKDEATGDAAIGLAFYCAEDDTGNWDETYLMPAANELGDLAQATVIGDVYSERAQHFAALPTGTLDAALQSACFTGVWVGTLATGELSKDLTLSPGDLDEAVAAFLKFSDSSDAVDRGESTFGSAFQRLDAFRTGFQESFNSGYNAGLTLCVDNGGAAAATDSSASDVFSS